MRKNVVQVAASALGIGQNVGRLHQSDELAERARATLGSAQIYLEEEPSIFEWFRELVPTRQGILRYLTSLFPFVFWIRRYNVRWLLGDVIAGVTICLVVVPQAVAYARLAGLTPEYGLYTSFAGASLYWFFGTSKDIVVGTTAVGSLLVGRVIIRVKADNGDNTFAAEDIAHTLGILCGMIMLVIGILRLGWLVEFIPYIAISAFTTAASITILSTQIPAALGITGIDSQSPPYRVIIDIFKALPKAKVDAFIGLTSLVMLFAIRGFCSHMEARRPAYKKVWAFVSSLRLSFTIMLFTLISYLIHSVEDSHERKFRIIGPIERGFRAIEPPYIDLALIQQVVPELPTIVTILVIEHIAISKAMGRLHNYRINPSQEVVALGCANFISPFFGGYICTGSFGGSAVLSKAGVRTPLAGVFCAVTLALSLYVLTEIFVYIPKAALAGLIIHSVCSLMTPPRTVYRYWQTSPLEFLIWVSCVLMGIFHSLDYSIFLGVALSILMLLFGVARSSGRFLGVVRAQRVPGNRKHGTSEAVGDVTGKKEVFLPLDGKGSCYNPSILVETAYPGVFVYRFLESFNYINQAMHLEKLQVYLTENTRRTYNEEYKRKSDRLWNDDGSHTKLASQHLPCLRALVIDFSTMNKIDVTSIQGLMDLREYLDGYAAPDTVEYHFAHVENRWTRRALAAAGFGYPCGRNGEELTGWDPRYYIASVEEESVGRLESEEGSVGRASFSSARNWERGGSRATVSAVDRPFFHADLYDAVDCAVRNAQRRR